MASERVPLTPPAAEMTAWLDAHALYLLPIEAHEQLDAALTEAAMQDAVDGLKARLSSPMFGVTGEQPRRDPLGLARLTAEGARVSETNPLGARPTAKGDLIAQDGRALLIQLQTTRGVEAVERDVSDAVADLPVLTTLVGKIADRARAETTIEGHVRRLVIVTLAGLTFVLAIALRSVRSVLAVMLCIGGAIAVAVLAGPPLTMLALPLVVLLAGFGCEGALHLQRISQRGWPAAAVLGTALVPLLLSPYPAWQAWSWQWAVGIVGVVLVLRLVLPALSSTFGGAGSKAPRGFRLLPARGLAVVLSVGSLAAGAWAAGQLSFRGFDRPLVDDDTAATRVMRDRFFDPRRVVEAETPGRDAGDAVARSAADARALAELVPEHATQVDSPGRYVLPEAELERRRSALTELKLVDRMDVLFELLSTRGFRPDAFGEFMRGASDLDTLPTPQAALEGPLGPWIARYLQEREDVVVVRNRVVLKGDKASVPEVERDEGPNLVLRGPAIGARLDRDVFADWLGIYIALQLWVGALVVWLGTRSLAVAIGAALAAMSAQTAVLAAMVPLRLPLGPEMVPALLLVGAAGMVAGGRACRAIVLRRPFFATGLLVTGLCQGVAGLALVATGEPAWSRVGLMIAIGAVAASGAGLFIAPGIAKLFRPEFGAGPAQPPRAEPEDEPQDEPQGEPQDEPQDEAEDEDEDEDKP